MHKAFVYRLYPTAAQAVEMQRQLDAAWAQFIAILTFKRKKLAGQ